MDQPLHDLIEIIHFTENVSTKIHGLMDEAEIYRVVRDKFAQSRRYTAGILLLTEDKSKLRVAEISAHPDKVKAAENAVGLHTGEYRIDLDQPSVYSQVVREGKTVHADLIDIASELLPYPRAHKILNSLGYGRKMTVLTPLEKRGEIIGVLAMSAPDLVEYFVPSVRNLARHISTALELADEYDERRRTEQQLRQAEECYRALYESSIDGIVAADLEGHITDCNQAYTEMLGYSREELQRLTDTALMPPELHTSKEDVLREVMERGYSYEFEREYIRKDGTVFPVSVRTWKIDDEAGHPTGTYSIVRDITERKRAEAELAQHRQHLEDLVEQRTAELALATAQLEALRQLGLELTAQLDLDDLLHSIASQAITLLGGTAGGLDIYLPERDVLEWAGTIGTDWKPSTGILQRGEGIAGRVWETGQPLIVDDYQHWEGRTNAWEICPVASIVSVPVRWGEELLGVLNVSSDSLRAFSPADAELLSLFATQAAIAIRNAHLYEAERKRVAQLTVVNQVARKAISILDLEQLLQEIVAAIQQGFGYYNVAVLLLDDTTGELKMRAIAGGFEDLVPPDYHQTVEAGMLGWTVKTGRPLLANDVNQEPHYIPGFMDRVPTQSELCVPLRLANQVIGAFDVQDTRENVFDESDLTAMETLADQIAVAIKNARLYKEAQGRAGQLEVVNRIARAAGTILHLDDLVETTYREINATFQVDAFFIALYDEETDELDFRLRVDEGVRDHPGRKPLGTGLTSLIVARREPLLIRDFEQERPDLPSPLVWGTMKHTRSWLGVPMQIGDQVIGVISVQAYHPHVYGEEEQLLLSTIADQVAVAVENARLFEREYTQRELAEALEGAAAAVSSTLDLDQVLDIILEQVERVVVGDTFNIMLIGDSTARVVRHRGYECLGVKDPLPRPPVSIAEYPSLVKMARTGKPVVVQDTTTDHDWIPKEGRGWRHSYVGAPIQVGKVTVGFLNVSGTQPGQFKPADAHRLETFARHAATAIENARLYQELQDYAESLEERVQERTAEIQAQYAQLDAILRSATDGIVVTDAAGEILQANPVAQAWLVQTLSPKDATRLREAARDLAQQASAVPMPGQQPEIVLELPGLDLELKAASIPEPRGGEAAVVVVVHDVTHLKVLDRMKTHFVSNVSHELRTPVTTIKLYTHLLQRTSPHEEKWQAYLTALAQEANRQAQLVEDILQISRIDAGRLALQPCPTSLNELAARAIDSHQVLAREQGLTLEHHPRDVVYPPSALSPCEREGWDEGLLVLVDPERTMQVLNNLVENAIHYTPPGGAVTVFTGQAEAEGRVWATMSVADTGIGIPEDELPHVFERFFRGKEPRVMQVSGTGLGLAIVREIVELHGGHVTVESQAGKGTTFTIWLPLAV